VSFSLKKESSDRRQTGTWQRSTFVVTIPHLFDFVYALKPLKNVFLSKFLFSTVANTQLNHWTKHRGTMVTSDSELRPGRPRMKIALETPLVVLYWLSPAKAGYFNLSGVIFFQSWASISPILGFVCLFGGNAS
jgi:hypothetical protein